MINTMNKTAQTINYSNLSISEHNNNFGINIDIDFAEYWESLEDLNNTDNIIEINYFITEIKDLLTEIKPLIFEHNKNQLISPNEYYIEQHTKKIFNHSLNSKDIWDLQLTLEKNNILQSLRIQYNPLNHKIILYIQASHEMAKKLQENINLLEDKLKKERIDLEKIIITATKDNNPQQQQNQKQKKNKQNIIDKAKIKR